ncbi:MAG: response regulator [Desulfotignum sp.]
MKGSKILLVDDEIVFTTNMSRLLVNRGYQVTAVNSGDAAIQELEKDDFDVVVLDLKMPGMDGIATLKEIKKLELFTQTLILTGHGSIDSALEAVRLGAYDYLTKPCEIDDLVSKIECAWQKKDEHVKEEMQENVQKIIESPHSVFDLYPSKDKKK